MQRKKRVRRGSMVLATAMLLSLLPVRALAANPSFSDIQDHWGRSAIERWSANGVVSGKGGGLFDPDAHMTRAEMAQMYVNLLHLSEKADLRGYTDVPADAWYADAVAKCLAAGILSGTGSNTISPLEPVTREQMFVTFGRALGIKPAKATGSDLHDLVKVSDWARETVYALLEAGYISGTGDNTLMPLADIDRASVAALLDATVSGYAGEPGSTLKMDKKGGIALVAAKDVTVTGTVGDIVVTPGAAAGNVTFRDATVTGTITVAADSARLNVTEKSRIENVVVHPQAKNAMVSVDQGSSVNLFTTEAGGTTVSGQGTVKQVVAAGSSSGVKITTAGTTVKNNSRELVATNQAPVKPGQTADTSALPSGNPPAKPAPSGGSSSGHASSGHSSSGHSSSGGGVASYTVTFAPNGGRGEMERVSVAGGASYTLPACKFTAPANQKFKAWKIGETEYAPGTAIAVKDSVSVAAVWEDTAAKQAVDAAWKELDAALAGVKGHDGARLVTITSGNGTYAMTLDVDAIQAAKGAFADDQLNGLATAVKQALDRHFGSYALTVNDQKVYVDGVFQHTALKNALFSVADGFFYTLSRMDDNSGIYTYKTVNARADGADSYAFTVAVQLKGEDVAKVKKLASILADHLSMEKLSAAEIQKRYGLENIGETEAIVVTMEMPDALMKKAVQLVTDKKTSAQDIQETFDRQTVRTFLSILKEQKLDSILGSGVDGVNSLLSTLNSNANLINKVLSKMTVSVNGQNFFKTEHGTFTPGAGDDAYHQFMSAVLSMTSKEIQDMTPAQFKCSKGAMGGTYYAVPVKMDIDLGASMGFRATETVIVVLHIDFSPYLPSPVTDMVPTVEGDFTAAEAAGAAVSTFEI